MAWFPIFSLHLFLALLIFVSFNRNCDSSPPPPEISLLVWVGSDLVGGSADYLNTQISHDLDQDAPITLVNGSTYILTSEVTLIAFMCKARYPIEWEFSNSKWLLLQEKTFGLYVTTSRRISDESDIYKNDEFQYWSEVALLGDSRMYIGTYSCKDSRNDGILSSNITLFWEGGPSDSVFVLSQKNIKIFIEEDDTVIFPCHVNNPFANVVLQKENETKSQNSSNQSESESGWITVSLTSRWTYKPEVGFIYSGDRNAEEYPAAENYRCVLLNEQNQIDQDSEDVVYLTLDWHVYKRDAVQIDKPIKTNATFQYNQGKNRYECCSSSATPPNIQVHSCCDPSTCKELVTAIKTQQSSISSSKPKIASGSVGQVYSPQLANYFNRKNGSCLYTSLWQYQSEMDIVQCIGDGISVVKNNMDRNPKNLSVDDWNSENLKKWVSISPHPWNNHYPVTLVKDKTDTYQVYTESALVFRCQSPFYFFSYGVRFSTKNAHGFDKVLPDTFEADSRKRSPTQKMLLLLHSPPLTAEVNLTITPYLQSLTCHVPVTNSTDWAEQTIYFSIKIGEKPSIVSDEVSSENVVWMINQTDVTLTCKIKGGDPVPKGIESKFNVTRRDEVTYILKIPKVTHEIQGEFKCIASNFKGQAEKTFIVYAEEIGTTHTAAIIITVFVILGIICGVGYLVYKLILQKKSLDNLREHVYPQQGVVGAASLNNDGEGEQS